MLRQHTCGIVVACTHAICSFTIWNPDLTLSCMKIHSYLIVHDLLWSWNNILVRSLKFFCDLETRTLWIQRRLLMILLYISGKILSDPTKSGKILSDLQNPGKILVKSWVYTLDFKSWSEMILYWNSYRDLNDPTLKFLSEHARSSFILE